MGYLGSLQEECYVLRRSGYCRCTVYTKGGGGKAQMGKKKKICLNFSFLAIKYDFYFIKPIIAGEISGNLSV